MTLPLFDLVFSLLYTVPASTQMSCHAFFYNSCVFQIGTRSRLIGFRVVQSHVSESFILPGLRPTPRCGDIGVDTVPRLPHRLIPHHMVHIHYPREDQSRNRPSPIASRSAIRERTEMCENAAVDVRNGSVFGSVDHHHLKRKSDPYDIRHESSIRALTEIP